MPNSIRNPAVYGGSIKLNLSGRKLRSNLSVRYDGFNNTKRGA